MSEFSLSKSYGPLRHALSIQTDSRFTEPLYRRNRYRVRMEWCEPLLTLFHGTGVDGHVWDNVLSDLGQIRISRVVGTRPRRWLGVLDEISALLGDRDGGAVRISASDFRHDRCVDDAQSFDAMNAEVVVDD